MDDTWAFLRSWIRLNGVRSTLEPLSTYPEAAVDAIRSEPLQAKVMAIDETRVVVYITHVEGQEMLAVDVLR